MPRRLFIFLVLGLAIVAAVLYFTTGRSSHPRDLREAVPITHFTLANGLTVVVLPNDRIPAVTHMMVVKAGAADDPYSKSGVAHYLEHLMFTGSKNFPEGVYDHTIARVGGTQNAFTTKDYTAYFATVSREHLPEIMAMEADRFQNLLFDPPKVTRELKVITEERNMRIDNSALAQLSEQLDALTFLNHPYHHPTIGWAEDMATLTGDDARQFFAAHYHASNMVLILAGDITVSDARRYAKRYYNGLSNVATAPRDWPHEPPFRLERHATMHDAKAHEQRLVRQYVAPSVVEGATVQAPALALFAHYLGGNQTSFLYNKLVREEKLASSVEVEYDPFSIGPALFAIVATPVAGVSLEQLETALDRDLAEATTQLPDDASVARAKTQLKAETVFAQDGQSSLANVVAQLYALGLDEQTFYEWPNVIEKVTAADMHTAAATVLLPAKRITGYLLPMAPVAVVSAPVAPAAPAALTEVPHAP